MNEGKNSTKNISLLNKKSFFIPVQMKSIESWKRIEIGFMTKKFDQ